MLIWACDDDVDSDDVSTVGAGAVGNASVTTNIPAAHSITKAKLLIFVVVITRQECQPIDTPT